MAAQKQDRGLQVIFSFFLGLMVVALVVIGVYQFLPSPEGKYSRQMDKINRQLSAYETKTPTELSAADQAARDRLQAQQDAIQKQMEKAMRDWFQMTSIPLILLATAIMGVSLVRSDQLRVLSNGLLLGGLFTMIYGVGSVLFAGESWIRLVVILFATAITVGLGYIKFVRAKKVPEGAAAEGGAVESASLEGLTARVEALEGKLAALGDAFGGGR